jgi:N-methylhydantoinase A
MISEIASSASGLELTATEIRPMFSDGWLDAASYDRSQLSAGDVINGPAVVQEFGSTVPVFPGFRATVDAFGNLLITRSSS